MQIAFHIGANCTDEDRILKSLLKNVGSLSDVGIKVPGPGKYRRIIRETIQNLNGMPPAANTRGILLDAISTMRIRTVLCFPTRTSFVLRTAFSMMAYFISRPNLKSTRCTSWSPKMKSNCF